MLIGYFHTMVGREPILMQNNPYYVYDITFLEWQKRTVIKQEGKVFLCSKDDAFEVVCKRDFCYIIVVFTSKRKDSAANVYNICRKIVNELDRSVHSLYKGSTLTIYRQMIAAIKINQNWTAIHIAAKIGLEHYFEHDDKCFDKIDRQVLPDLMTPLHLAILHSNLSIVQLLVQHNASLDLVDVNGYNSMHFAAISAPDVLSFMLTLPGMFERAKKKTMKGCTPLHLSCYAHKLKNVNTFLRFGLSVSMLTLSPPFDTSTTQAPSNSTKSDQIVKFPDKEIDDLVIDSIFYGGTPLHWTKKQSELERFIELGFDINGLNAKGETALILKTRRMRFKCLMSLLCQGANVNAEDSLGNNALYYAVRQGDVSIVQALVVFDCDINHVSKNGESIRHFAATIPNGSINHKMILFVLASVGAKRCSSTMKGCNDGCSHTGSFDGKRFYRWPAFTKHKFYEDPLLKRVVAEEKRKVPNRKDTNLINMVAFDGGGIKGLITIQMVHELQKRLKRNFVDYFDWVSGTSTGSIIAVALLLGKSTVDIRSLYFRFKDKVMTGNRPYGSHLIEKLLKEEFGERRVMGEFFNEQRKFCLIPATLVDRSPGKMHLFRSYPSSERILNVKSKVDSFGSFPDHNEQLVWQAVRSSCAAPTYFHSFNDKYVDGGLVANNPTTAMLVEFNKYNHAIEVTNGSKDMKKLNTVVSFGTGHVTAKSFSLPELKRFVSWNPVEISSNVSYLKEMFNIVCDSACCTNFHVTDRNETWCANDRVPFFRINPELKEIMEMNETNDMVIVDCLWLTKVYMHTKKDAIDELVYFLESTWKATELTLNVNIK